MGCISSKALSVRPSSQHHHHRHHQFNRHLLAFLSPTQPTISALHLDHNLTDFEDAKHTIDALELIPDSKHEDAMDIGDVDSNTDSNDHSRRYSKSSSPDVSKDTIERCASFHTVEEYDALIRRISTSGENEIIGTEDDDDDDDRREMRRKKRGEALAGSLNVEFQTVGSLRQWLEDHLHSPDGGGGGGGGGGGRGGAAADYPTPKFGRYYDDKNTQTPAVDSIFMEIGRKQQEEESVPEVDPDLVAAFEEYMQQLQVEEDNILKLIEPGPAP